METLIAEGNEKLGILHSFLSLKQTKNKVSGNSSMDSRY